MPRVQPELQPGAGFENAQNAETQQCAAPRLWYLWKGFCAQILLVGAYELPH